MKRQQLHHVRHYSPPEQVLDVDGISKQRDGSPGGAARTTRNKPHKMASPEVHPQAPSQRAREGMIMRSSGPRAGCEQRSENIDEVFYDGWKLQVEHACTAYPKELIKTREPGDSCLFVCHKCFKYTMDSSEFQSHRVNGEEVQRPRGALVHAFDNDRYQIYEIDGALEEHRPFLQRMCLFGKFFIQNKSIWYEFENFLFYTLVEKSSLPELSFSYCGFFSKEKTSYDENNLSCIILYPQYRSRGLGSALIDFSYYVSKLSGKMGGPEKPISDLGKRGYSGYWGKSIALSILSMTKRRRQKQTNASKLTTRVLPRGKTNSGSLPIRIADIGRGQTITIERIACETGIATDDVLETLIGMEVIEFERGNPILPREKLRRWIATK
ncbi:hypothetical protein TWF694_003908 [Orbilia ellipsospora]|uniref:histone acetyltransferase n=1 Tax=Orbilia ellipsospora TaxID=2528407 RepID=A0AAV9WWG8_9PEZI